MKSLFKTVVLLTIIAISITACDKSSGIIIPDPDPDGDHPVLWSYDIGFGSLDDIIPAIGPDNSVYFSLVGEDFNTIYAIGLDSDGNELWKNEFEGNATGKVMYIDGKVIVSTGYPTAIYCINASSGNIEWSNNLTNEYDFVDNPSLAYANSKLYILSYQSFYGFIMAYSLEGDELMIQQTSSPGFNLSVYNNALLYHDLDTLYGYEDTGAGITPTWKWGFPEEKNNRSLFSLYDIPIGDDGSIFIRDDLSIYIVSQTGQLTKSISLDESFNQGYISNLSITAGNDIILGNGNLVKINENGNIEWETNINDGMIINPTFTSSPVLSSNGNMYDAQLFGLYSVKSNGSLNWKVNSESGAGIEYGNLHPPVLSYDGNIISVSSEQSVVRCFKGDGQGLATGGWPKPFGNYANTSSK